MPFMEGLATGAGYGATSYGLSAVTAPLNMYLTDIDRRRNERSSKRLMEHQAQVTDELQAKRNRSSMSELAEGAANAGFSPLAALDAATSGSQPSNVMPSSSTKQVDAPSLLEASQARLANAEAMKAETEAVRMRHEDLGTNRALISFSKVMLNDPRLSEDDKLYWNHIIKLGEAGELNLGDLQSQKNFENLVVTHSDQVTKVVANEYSRLLVEAQKKAGCPEWLAAMPEMEAKKLGYVIGEIYAETMKLNSDTTLNMQKVDEVRANISKLIAEAKSISHNDVVELWNTDKTGLFVRLGYGALENIGDSLPAIITKGRAPKTPPNRRRTRQLTETLSKHDGGYTRQTREVMSDLAQ